MLIVTIAVFIVLLLVLVLVHEWGHFIAAKKAGCHVKEFGFGFPPRLASFTRNGTKFSLNLLPIGGFVKIEGEDMNEADPGPQSFASKSAAWRTIILAAGVGMNMVLAVVLLAIQSVVGFPTLLTDQNATTLTDQKTYIIQVQEGSPAAVAGLQEFDRIVRVGDIEQPTIEQFQAAMNAASGSEVILEIERQGQHLELALTPRTDPPPNEGPLGVALTATGLQKVPMWQAPWAGLKRSAEMLVAISHQFSLIVQRLVSEGNLGGALTGPIGIAIYANEATKQGLSYLLEFAALISLNLAMINILPLPALDGGRILFIALEKIVGRRATGKVENYAHTAGFVLLILLMIAITYRDIQRFF